MNSCIKWAPIVALFMLFSCNRVDEIQDTYTLNDAGAFGQLSDVTSVDEPDTKATVEYSKMHFDFEVGDRINIWSASGTTLFYKVESVTNGRAKFSGGGFTLTPGETYYSAYPLIRSTADEFTAISVSYDGQTQTADNDVNHVAEYTYAVASAVCSENYNTSFNYERLNSYFKFEITLPVSTMTLTKLIIKSDAEEENSFFAVNGSIDVTNNSFTPGDKVNSLTLKLDNVTVKDGVLNAALSVPSCDASNYVIQVIDSEGTVYTSPKISKPAIPANKFTTFKTEVFEGENPPVAIIGNVSYSTITAALEAAQNGDTIEILQDYDATSEPMTGGSRQFVVSKSITIDGKGHTVTTKQRGFGVGNVNGDLNPSNNIDVTFKDIAINNTTSGARCIDTRGKIGSLTLDGVTLSTDGASGYTQPLTIGGNQSETATVNITNSTIQTNDDGTAYYAIITFNPVKMTVSNSTLKGWACIYAKGKDGSAGSAGSVFTVTNSTLESSNIYNESSNAFGAIVFEDNNIEVDIEESNINIHNSGDQSQSIVLYPENNSLTNCSVSMGNGNKVLFDNSNDKGNCYYVVNQGEGNTFAVSGGVFSDPVPGYCCAEGKVSADNTDEATKEQYPYTVADGVYVAKVGGNYYEVLEEAFAAAKDGDVITLLTDCAGNGIVAPQGKFGTTGLTVDFANHTYTITGAPVGSTGTETQAFQLLKDNKITFKGGSIVGNNADVLMMIQNYSALTLDGMTLDATQGSNNIGYVLSTNNGSTIIKDTKIVAKSDGTAFDACSGWGSYQSNTVEVLGTSEVTGPIEVSFYGQAGTTPATLLLTSGTHNGDLVMADGAAQCTVTKTDDTFAQDAPAGYKWVSNSDGTSTLKACEYVAKIGDVMYESLADAIAAVQNGETILMTADVDNAAGMSVASGKNFTVDFQNHTYTLNKPGAGSTGTETNGFQFLMGSTITLKNGKINISEENLTPAVAPAKNIMRIIQNYANLTLDNMTIDGTNQYGGKDYVVSYNNGSSVIKDTKVIAGTDNIAFDVCRYSSYPSVNVTVTGSSEITGKIEVSASGSDAKDGFGLTVESGTISGGLVIYGTAATAMVNTPDKAVVKKSNDVALAAPANFKWEDNNDGTSTLKAKVYVATIGDEMYETLEEAFAAAQDGQTIKLTADCAGNGIVAPQGKFTNGVTVDFDGHTYTMDGAMVGSAGTQTQAFQLLKENKITFKNGTLTSTKVSMMIQNYSDLTLEDMMIDGSSAPYCNYVVSNNRGKVNIIGNTSIKAANGNNAFDVCWAPYNGYPEGAQITVNTTGTITGTIEYDLWGANATPVLSTLDITAGNFENFAISTVGPADFKATAEDNIQITGGTFDADPSDYVADGYMAVGSTAGGKKVFNVVKCAVYNLNVTSDSAFEDIINTINSNKNQYAVIKIASGVEARWECVYSDTRTLIAADNSSTKIIAIEGPADGNASFRAIGNGVRGVQTGAGTVRMKNLTVYDDTRYEAENGNNAWEFAYLEFKGDFECKNVVFADGIQPEGNSSIMAFSDCKFIADGNAKRDAAKQSDEYTVWISAGTMTFNNCEFTGFRGPKIHEKYGTDVTSVAFDGCLFKDISKKPGVIIGDVDPTTTISIKNSTFTNCQPGDQGLYMYESDTNVSTFNFVNENNTVNK